MQYQLYPEPLGEGGYGTVYRAKHLRSGHMYAVKCLQKCDEFGEESDDRTQNIRREAWVMEKMRHSLNVVHLHEVFEDNEQVYMVLELCEGGDLWTHREIASGQFSEYQAADIIRAILRAVAQCHVKDICYRDVKPENFLFVTGENVQQIRAVDFGLAAPCPPGCVLTQQCGSPFHVAPEVINQEYGLPADMWGVGVVAYQMLSGEVPFQDPDSDVPYPFFMPESGGPMFSAILNQPVVLTGGAWDTVSDDAKDFVQRLLDRDPLQRPTASDALRHRWVQGTATSAPLGVSVVQRLQRFGSYGRFKQEAMKLMAQEIIQDDESLASLKGVLQELDADGTGLIQTLELHSTMREAGYMLTVDELDYLVEKMTRRGSEGYVPIDEFVAALADLREVQSSSRWEQMARGAFSQLDHEGTGRLMLNRLVDELCVGKDDEQACKVELADEVRSVASVTGLPDEDCEIEFDVFKKIISRDDLSNDLELYATRAPRASRSAPAEKAPASPEGATGGCVRELLLQG